MKMMRGGVNFPKGFRSAGIACGIKRSKKPDLAMIVSDGPCQAAGFFTSNRVKAFCVRRNLKVLKRGRARVVVANSGNANCLTGPAGERHNELMAQKTAYELGLDASEVLTASTGIIGVPLPIDEALSGVSQVLRQLSNSPEAGTAAARAILTTDRIVKEKSVRLSVGGVEVRLGAMAKGAGMIAPRMTNDGQRHATMLCFVTTDAAISVKAITEALEKSVSKTFNAVTVDGDMSTNDMAVVLANGRARNRPIEAGTPECADFARALRAVFLALAKDMVRDAEGATKFVEVSVKNARTEEDARSVAMHIADSKLVKTALFGSDPNWGRIAAAAGSADAFVDPGRIQVWLGPHMVLKGERRIEQKPSDLARIFHKNQIRIKVDLAAGKASFTAWTCDLSLEYIRVNSAYRT